MLSIYIDFKSPAAYLALKPTRALLAETGTPVSWLPFLARQSEVPQRGTDESIAQSHKRVRAESRRKIFLKYAEIQGIEMRFPTQRRGTDLALGALAEIADDPLPYIAACFNAYWTQAADLDDGPTVSGLLARSGAVHDGDLTRSRDQLAAALDAAHEIGIVDAPAYLVGSDMFVGREHLPWVRACLTQTR